MTRRSPSEEGRKVALNMRTTQEVRERLEASAARSGRSLTHEVEYLVGQALDLNEQVGGAFAATFYANISKLLRMLPLDAFLSRPYLAKLALTVGIEELVKGQFVPLMTADAYQNGEPRDAAGVQERVEEISRNIALAILDSAQLQGIAANARSKGEAAPQFGEQWHEHASRLMALAEQEAQSPEQKGTKTATGRRSNRNTA